MDVILHQYAASPYAEIVRLALGIKGLSWARVEQSNMMPRPHLSPLTGGYRRIPVMQIGAEIYCDTGLILRELDRRFPQTRLDAGQEGLSWALRGWAERAWFGVTVAVVFGERADLITPEFAKDREALSGRPFDAAMLKAAAPLMRGQWRANADMLEERLRASGDFLFGARPGAADLAAFLNVWFLRSGAAEPFATLTKDMPNLAAWVERMDSIGHGAPHAMAPEAALAVAAAANPEQPRASASNDAQGLRPGMRASVMPDDYGRLPTDGEITFVSPQEIALRRDTPEAGAVVTHFPRAGFLVIPQ